MQADLLCAPAIPVGREPQLRLLRGALHGAAAGERRVVFVGGRAGVGKTALIEQLRPAAQALGGRFVTGRFEKHDERETPAFAQALGTLAGLLLAESDEEERALLRGKILRSLGARAGLARVVPQFDSLIGDVEDPGTVDPAQAAARMVEVVTGLLRAVVSPIQPLVLVLDDLQWGGALSIRLIDAVLAARDLPGLLLLLAYRDDELGQVPPLASAMARWTEEESGCEFVRVANLAQPEVARLLSQMLKLTGSGVTQLAEALAACAQGNPYDTIELLNALRDEGILAAAMRTGREAAAVRQFLERTSVYGVLAARIGRLPESARELLLSLACIGAQTTREVACAALGWSAAELDAAVGILCERGFLMPALAPPAGTDALLRFRHQNVRQGSYAALAPSRRSAAHLRLARRLAVHASMTSLAADQYVLASGEPLDTQESAPVAALLRDAAAQARRLGNHAAACRLLDTALRVQEAAQRLGAANADDIAACEVDYHLALTSTGRLEDADAIFRRIEARVPDARAIIDAACAQVTSLVNRGRIDEGEVLGLRVLDSLGLLVPRDFGTNFDFAAGYTSLCGWVEDFDMARECARTEAGSERVVAIAKMVRCLGSVPIYRNEMNLLAWLIFTSQQLWEEAGPCGPLLVNFGRTAIVTIAQRADWRTGYLAARQALDLCEARGWETEASQLRSVCCMTSSHWFEPLERTLGEAERAREGLLAAGDLRLASFSQRVAATCVFDGGPSLLRFADEVALALSLARRANNQQAIAPCVALQQLLRTLTGEIPHSSVATGRDISNAQPTATDLMSAFLVWSDETWRRVVCAIFGEAAGLSRFASDLTVLQQPRFPGQSLYQFAWSYWLSGLAAAWELHAQRAATGDPQPEAQESPGSLGRLDTCIEWLRQRAIDAPLNFRHMHLHLVAERAWATGDTQAAVCRFDEALSAADRTSRPWHQALITERAARLHLARGCHYSGSQLLLDAQQRYAAWGATAKVKQLSAETGGWVSAAPGGGGAADPGWLERVPPADTLDVLRALRALGAQTSTQRLQSAVEEAVGAVAGATHVVLVLRDEESSGWIVRAADGTAIPLDSAGDRVPLMAFRYAERMREPLLLGDAVVDERFARDAFFRDVERCSLMVVPIASLGTLRAMLVLENRTIRDAFSSHELDVAMMIAAQLAVSLESAQLYERLERRVNEQSSQLRQAQARLLEDARRSGMAQVAVNVLHNVGNLLTSVNVSVHMLVAQVRESRTARVADLAELMEANAEQFGSFFAPGEKGGLLPGYVRELAEALQDERAQQLAEIARLEANIARIMNVVAAQQEMAAAQMKQSRQTRSE